MMEFKFLRMMLIAILAMGAMAAHGQTVNRALKGDRLPVHNPQMFGGEVEEWDERANPSRIGVTDRDEPPVRREREPARPHPTNPANCQGMNSDVCMVFSETNRERAQNGLPEFRVDPACQRAADDHARDMASSGYFSHTGRNGSSISDRYSRYGRWTVLAENIAMGTHMDSRSAVQSWMKSPGHRRNILGSQYGSMGVGIAQGGRYRYFVQCFSR